jgi:hypothetical protein
MNPKLHPRVAEIIDLFIHKLSEVRPGLLEGYYLYGSIALGDYSIESSDIDFISVTRDRLAASDIDAVRAVHEEVERQYALPNLSGIYLTWDDIGKLEEEITPFPYYADGRMHDAGYFELNLVTWFELQQYGIAVTGPSVEQLNIQVDWELLVSSMQHNLNTYWKNWIRKSQKLFSPYADGLFFRRTDLEWGVLGICRLFYTFRERNITSKAAAGHYALGIIPEKWHRVVEEAILAKRGVSFSLYKSKVARKKEALTFMRYISRKCNTMLQSEGEYV